MADAVDPKLEKKYPATAADLRARLDASAAEHVPQREPPGRYANTEAAIAEERRRHEAVDAGAPLTHRYANTAAAMVPPPLELEAPEGFDAQSPTFGEFRKLAGELGLDKERAGKVLALYKRDIEEQEKAWKTQVDGWRAELERDEEIIAGTDAMRTFVAEHGGKEFIDALGELGNHPAVIRGLVRMTAAAAKQGGRR